MISVVIPAFNAEETIERALDSVLGQSYMDLEVIVVDDGSRDGTADIVQFHARRDPRVRLLQHEHSGPSSARNVGIDAASGEWLAFLDADDEYVPRAFETVLDEISARDIGLVIFGINTIRSYLYAWPAPLAKLEKRFFEANRDRPEEFIREYVNKKRLLVYSQSNKLYRRSIIDAHHVRFPEQYSFGEDRLFNYLFLRHAGSILTLNKPLLKYHHGRPGALSDGPVRDEIHTLLALSRAKLDLFRDFGYSEADLDDFRLHEARQVLDGVVRALIRRHRIGRTAAVRHGVRELLSASLEPHFFSHEAAVSRRVRLLQVALQTRQVEVITALVSLLRHSEDRRVLRTRRAEIDRTNEIKRMKLTDVSRRERARYYYLADYEHFLDRINPEHSRNVLRDKGILLRRLAASSTTDFLGREWLDLRRASFAEFEDLIDRSDRIVAKLFNGRWGSGTEVIDVSSGDLNPEELHERLITQKKYVVEAYLEQHPDVARFYADALTTLRIHTLNLGGRVQIVLPSIIKLGSNGAPTSNDWSIEAYVDLTSGTIISDGAFQGAKHKVDDETYVRHPDSGEMFRGSQLPFIAEAKRLVLEAAPLVPELPFIGWDIAFTPTGPVLVEGNAASMFLYSWQIYARQLLGKHGMRDEMEQLFKQFTHFERRQRRLAARPNHLRRVHA